MSSTISPNGPKGPRGSRADKKRSERSRGSTDRPHFDQREGVPMLRYGTTSNFLRFKELLATYALREYGNVARLIETDEYYEPPEVDTDYYDPSRRNAEPENDK